MNEAKRLEEIIGIIRKNGGLHEMNPEKLKNLIEELGPTFIKLGQIISLRPDLLPTEYCHVLATLRSDVTSMPYEEVREILKDAYLDDLDNIFQSISKTPIGSASIAQVHRAKLVTGEEVILKIQRTNIERKMELDVKLLKKAISVLHIQKLIHNIIDLQTVLDEMWNAAVEELNFLTEAKHIEEFTKNNEDISFVKAPTVYKKITKKNILVMEYIDGYDINNLDKLKSDGYDIKEISTKLANNYLKQALDDGFFHADPHPNNIKIANGKIVFLDFGMMGRLNNKDKDTLKACAKAILKNDIKEVERNLLMLGEYDEIDHVKLCGDLDKILTEFRSTDIKSIDVKKFMVDMINLLSSNKIKLSKNISMLMRGIVVLESSLEEIDPDINLIEALSTRFKDDYFKTIFTKEYGEKTLKNIMDATNSLTKLPNSMETFLDMTNRGELRVNMEMNDSKKQFNKLEHMLHQLIVCLLDVGLILGTSLLSITLTDTSPSYMKLLFYLFSVSGIILTAWLFIRMLIEKGE